MGEKSILEQAKLGNSNAIAEVMNQLLQPLGSSCTVKTIGDRLYVFVESLQVPDQKAVVTTIRQAAIAWQIDSIKSVKIYARQLEDKVAAWSQEFNLEQKSETPLPNISSPKFNSNGNSHEPVQNQDNNGSVPKIAPKKPKKSSQIWRNLEIILVVFVTFVVTTVLWDRWGFFKPLNYSSELSNLLNSWLILVNKRTATISGGAWVTKEAGNSDILRGLEIALCKASVKPEIKRVRDNKWRESLYKNKTPIGYWHLNIEAMNAKVSAHTGCFQVVKTGIEGKYTIPDVPFGSYFLYAPYETSVAKAYWMVPVEIESTKQIQIDLDNSNMMELYNRE
ncbi:MAG TPA: hypothetical protein DDW76_05045 [Cyanobacteria bacterium UBA11369]|nr:hypothetical protein [Cyanobacteria bacterium UBA11371]HBE34958.1 hypothetical protein [Cyanobacteria bacterium UBA11368]HBE48173.1 hypothetical protein [Cyanobacteria bacterium UBA11369]